MSEVNLTSCPVVSFIIISLCYTVFYMFRFFWCETALMASQATVIAAYLSEPMIFSIASTGFNPTHCMT